MWQICPSSFLSAVSACPTAPAGRLEADRSGRKSTFIYRILGRSYIHFVSITKGKKRVITIKMILIVFPVDFNEL